MSDEAKETTITALRDDLARRGREAHQRLDALLATMSEEQLTRPGVTDDWSVKDHLAHLTWWGRRIITVLHGGDDPIDAMPGGEKTEDEINANVYAANRDRSLAEVRAAFDASYQQTLALAESLSAEDLADEVLYGLIAGDTFDHYREHIEMLENGQR
jgi:hypothetical protein